MSRIDKINRELRNQISVIIQQELNDPSIGFVTVTSVSTSPDLSQALVYFTCMGDNGEKDRTQKTLNKASGYIRKLLGERLYIKSIPHLTFIYDDTARQKSEIDKLLDQINEEEKNK